jgi:transposase InsO family protein
VLLELSVVEQRYDAVMAVLRDRVRVVDVAARYGVSRQSVHAWIRRYETGGLGGLADRSHRPQTCPHQSPVEVEARVCELRRLHPDWGPRRLHHELERDGLQRVPSRSAIYRILVRNHLIDPAPRRRRDYQRWERGRAMELWQMDVMGGVLLTSGQELKVVTGIDDHSRYCVAAGLVERAQARAVCGVFTDALGRHGIPDEVLTDNGKVFTGRFGNPGACRDAGLRASLGSSPKS